MIKYYKWKYEKPHFKNWMMVDWKRKLVAGENAQGNIIVYPLDKADIENLYTDYQEIILLEFMKRLSDVLVFDHSYIVKKHDFDEVFQLKFRMEKE